MTISFKYLYSDIEYNQFNQKIYRPTMFTLISNSMILTHLWKCLFYLTVFYRISPPPSPGGETPRGGNRQGYEKVRGRDNFIFGLSHHVRKKARRDSNRARPEREKVVSFNPRKFSEKLTFESPYIFLDYFVSKYHALLEIIS